MSTARDVFSSGAAAIFAVLVVFEIIARRARQKFLAPIILGLANRTAPAQTFVFIWTLLIGWAVACLLIAGEFGNTHACAAESSIQTAIEACAGVHDQIGLLQTGWRRFLEFGMAPGYLTLLGIPAATAVAARLATRSTKLRSADNQVIDTGDFQYMFFNLVAAAYFIAQFMRPAGVGLPPMPSTIIGLIAISAGLYTAKQAAA
jgi:hypothetical protein